MLKNIVVFFVLVILYFSVCIGVSNADAKMIWEKPQYIKTYIQPNHPRTTMMKHAFAEWSRKTNDKVIFRYVDSTQNSQLDVFFVNKIDKENIGIDRAIGLTHCKYHGNKIYHATIWISEYDPDGKKLGNDAVYTAMLHEVGHSIGLEHSMDKNSVMYPQEDDKQEILNSDLNRLYIMYGWGK